MEFKTSSKPSQSIHHGWNFPMDFPTACRIYFQEQNSSGETIGRQPPDGHRRRTAVVVSVPAPVLLRQRSDHRRESFTSTHPLTTSERSKTTTIPAQRSHAPRQSRPCASSLHTHHVRDKSPSSPPSLPISPLFVTTFPIGRAHVISLATSIAGDVL